MPRPHPRKRAPIPDFKIDLEAIAAHEYRTRQINVKVTPSELDSIRAMAKWLRVSQSDYFLGLHRQAVTAAARMKQKKGN
jgi:hypothetical protein